MTVEDVETPRSISPADVLRPLSDVLDTESLALNYFELAPSERFGYAYHRHRDQEEVFYVQAGTVTFRTESGEVDVAAGEVIRVPPGEFQLGRNEGDERVVALALGAPRETAEIEYFQACPECDERTIQVPETMPEEGRFVVRCTACRTVVDAFALLPFPAAQGRLRSSRGSTASAGSLVRPDAASPALHARAPPRPTRRAATPRPRIPGRRGGRPRAAGCTSPAARSGRANRS